MAAVSMTFAPTPYQGASNNSDQQQFDQNNMFDNMTHLSRSYRGLVLPVRFNGSVIPALALVDSGADKTLVSKALIYSILPKEIVKKLTIVLNDTSGGGGMKVVTASNSPINITGFVSGLKMRVATLNSTVTLDNIPIVDGLTPDVIMGHDTLKRLHTRITFDDNDMINRQLHGASCGIGSGSSGGGSDGLLGGFMAGGVGGGARGGGSITKSLVTLCEEDTNMSDAKERCKKCATFDMDNVRSKLQQQQRNPTSTATATVAAVVGVKKPSSSSSLSSLSSLSNMRVKRSAVAAERTPQPQQQTQSPSLVSAVYGAMAGAVSSVITRPVLTNNNKKRSFRSG